MTPVTREFSEDEILNELLLIVAVKRWRHGTTETMVFERLGEHWQFDAQIHHSEGMQLTEPIVATQVHQVKRSVMVWEPVTPL